MRQSILCSLLFGTLLTAAHAGMMPSYPFVYVNGTAQIRVAPNVANAGFTVLAESASPAAAEDTVSRRVAEVLRFLNSEDVAANQIDASDLTKDAETNDDSNNRPLIIRGYRVSRQISIRISDLKRWPEIATYLLKEKNVADVQVSFGRSDTKKIRLALLGKAARDATARAEQLAKSFGRRAGKVMALSQVRFSAISQSFGFGFYDEGAEAVQIPPPPGDATRFVPSSIRISVQVNAIVRLK